MTQTRHEPGWYEIHVGGRLGERWASWFDGMTLTAGDDGTTVLTGQVADQSALHGILARLRDLGLPLLKVVRLDDEAPAKQGQPT
jgi:hypothetical protein